LTTEDTWKPSTAIPYSLRNKPYLTKEDIKAFWLEAGKVYYQSLDCKIYNHQEINFLDIIKEELDLSKLETVLDIGVGYGRLAKIILDNTHSIKQYDGIDISQIQLDRSIDYVRYAYGESARYFAYRFDFDDIKVENWIKYDLVISTEVMTCFPFDVKPWIDKMISLSKKYVLNLDHYTVPREKSLEDNILRNWHFYPGDYTSNKDIVNLKGIKIPEYSQTLFVGRVK
jgi:SAM-dependent methyltransferase